MSKTCAAALFLVVKFRELLRSLELRNAHRLTYRSYTARHTFQLTVMRTIYCVSTDLHWRTKARRLCSRDEIPLHIVLSPRRSKWCLPLDRNKDFSLRHDPIHYKEKAGELAIGGIGRTKYRKTPHTWTWRREPVENLTSFITAYRIGELKFHNSSAVKELFDRSCFQRKKSCK